MDMITKISSIEPTTPTNIVLNEKNSFGKGLSWGLTLSSPVDPFFEVPSQTMTLNSEIHRIISK